MSNMRPGTTRTTSLQRKIIKTLNDNPRATYKAVAAKCQSSSAYVSDIARRFKLERYGRDLSLDVEALVERYSDCQFADSAEILDNPASFEKALKAASDIGTDAVTLDELSRCEIEEIQKAVLKNLAVPQSAVDHLADHPNDEIAALAVMNVSTEKLAQYLQHPSHEVRESMLYHHEVPDEIYVAAFSDPYVSVRSRAVLFAKGGSLEKASFLINDPAPEVRRVLARNQHTPTEFLRRLAVDTDADVVVNALTHFTNFHPKKELIKKSSEEVRIRLATEAPEGTNIRSILCGDESIKVLCAAASHPRLESGLLNRLIERARSHPDGAQLNAVILDRPFLPKDIRDQLQGECERHRWSFDQVMPEAFNAQGSRLFWAWCDLCRADAWQSPQPYSALRLLTPNPLDT